MADTNSLKEQFFLNSRVEHDATPGPVVSFNTDLKRGIKNFTAQIEPVQDLHGYDYPWPPGGGKNKFPITLTTQTVNGTTFTVSSDGHVTVSGTPTETTRVSLNSLSITPESNMFFSMTGSATGIRVFCKRDESGTVTYPTMSPSTNVVAGVTYSSFLLEVTTSFSGTAVTLGFQIEFGSSASAWSPYENLCPIEGWNYGVNQWDEEWEIGNYSVSDGTKGTFTDRICCKNKISVKPDTKYYLGLPGNEGARVSGYDKDGVYIGQIISESAVTAREFTTPSNCYYIAFNMMATYGTNYKNDVSINYPSTDHDYHPYGLFATVRNTGKNLCNSVTRYNATNFTTNLMYLKAGVTYTLSYNETIKHNAIYFRRSDTISTSAPGEAYTYAEGSWSVTPKETGTYFFQFYKSGTGWGDNTVTNVQLEPGSTAHTCESYAGSYSNPIMWRSQSGTVYGGNVMLNEDGSCELTATHGIVDLGTKAWGYNASNRFYNSWEITNFKRATSTEERGTGLICSAYKPSSVLTFNNNQDDFSWLRGTTSMNLDVCIKDSRYSDPDNFKAAMNGVQLVYELAEPITYHLDTIDDLQTLIGTNNIWLDCGDISALKYYTQNPQYGMKWKEDRALELRRRAIIASSPTLHDVQSETGLVSFNADMVAPMKLTAQIEPVQDLHGYDAPWPPGGWKNIANEAAVVATTASTATYNDVDETVSVTGNTNYATGHIYVYGLKANVTYVFSCHVVQATENTRFALRSETGNATIASAGFAATSGDDLSFTYTPTTDQTVRICLFSSFGSPLSSQTAIFSKIQCEVGSTPTAFAPYKNFCPISGWTGANVTKTGENLIKNDGSSKTYNGITFTVNSDGTVIENGTATNDAYYTYFFDSLPPGNYYFSKCVPNVSGGYDAFMWDATVSARAKKWDGISNSESDTDGLLHEFMVEAGHRYRFSCRVSNGTTVENIVFKPLVCASTCTDATYEPYQGATIPVSWETEAGTVYGGNLTVNRDGNVDLVATFADVDMGTLSWSMSSSPSKFYARVPEPFYKMGRDTVMISSQYRLNGIGSSAGGYYGENGTLRYNFASTPSAVSCEIYVHDDNYSNAADFKTAMSGVQLVYELHEPQTYHLDNLTQLTTLLGTNNIWTDTGGIDVKYWSHGSQNNS